MPTTKKCLNPKCNKEFTPKNKKGVYCSGNCRAAHAYQLSKETAPEELKSNRERYLESCPVVDGLRQVNTKKLFEALEADGFRNAVDPLEVSKLTGLPIAGNEPVYTKDSKFGEVKKLRLPEQVTIELPIADLNPDNSTSLKKRIAELEAELKSPPKNPQIGLKLWTRLREKELSELKKQLK